MTKAKKELVERMTKKFTEHPVTEEKGYAVMCMIAYESGRAAGIEEMIEQAKKQSELVAG